MTGEMTLTGNVLKIGGVKDKVLAAKRNKLKRVILPASNQAEYDELEAHVKKDIDVHFVSTYDDIFDLVFDQQQQK
jgi:ATP-dependent Lon protease